MFWIGFLNPEISTEQAFVNIAKLFECALKVANEDKPFITHLIMNDKRIVSFWMYPGLSKNPTDRITELNNEIESLKELINKDN